MDKDIADMLRKIKKPVFLVVNKVDNSSRINDASEFYELGIDKYYPIASINGFGTGDLLDAIVENFSENVDLSDDLPKFAVVGRPNAGKSSLINALIGENRNIVTEIPGTTRDSVHTKYNRFGFEFNLIDTAGIRRKSKVKENLEFYSVMRSVRAIEHSDGSGDEYWDQTTSSRQVVASGLYIAHITDNDSGETAERKFVIIR